MRKRIDIKNEYIAIEKAINELKEKQIELNKEHLLLSDEEQWYTESEEELPEWIIPEGKKRSKRKMVKRLVGRIYWNEKFKDEDNPNESILITRNQAIKIDGIWALSLYRNLSQLTNGVFDFDASVYVELDSILETIRKCTL